MSVKKKVNTVSRTLNMYATYSFKDKDPVIDKLRTEVQDLAAKEQSSFYEIVNRAADEARLSRSTCRSWFDGATKRPNFATLNAFAISIGAEFVLRTHRGKMIHTALSKLPKLRVVK